MKKIYQVTLRNARSGDEHQRTILADDEPSARKTAVWRARSGPGKTMLEREYDRYDVVSCEVLRGRP
jgi:hypothetical protein